MESFSYSDLTNKYKILFISRQKHISAGPTSYFHQDISCVKSYHGRSEAQMIPIPDSATYIFIKNHRQGYSVNP